jgi:hypothetical protein
MGTSNAKLEPIIDRVMRTWSLIIMVPERRLPDARASVSALLEDNFELSESELLVMGFKHLHKISAASRKLD